MAFSGSDAGGFKWEGFESGAPSQRPQKQKKPRKAVKSPAARVAINLIVTLLVGAVYFYFELPALNLQSPDFYAFALLMCSRGVPMFLAGDEFCNTQFGNNNAYCQDNITSWLDWSRLEKNRGMFRFFQHMIRFRKEHRVVRTNLSNGACGFPDVSFHGVEPWCGGFFESHERYVGVMFAGAQRSTGPQVVYVASNAWWEDLEVTLPELPASMYWELAADTWEEEQPSRRAVEDRFTIRPRSVMVFVAR